MLSRIAESMFWIGRYVERAEDTARILDVQTQLLLEDPTGRRGDRPAAAARRSWASSSPPRTGVDAGAGARAARLRPRRRRPRSPRPSAPPGRAPGGPARRCRSPMWEAINTTLPRDRRPGQFRAMRAPAPLPLGARAGRADQRHRRRDDDPRRGLAVPDARPLPRARRHDRRGWSPPRRCAGGIGSPWTSTLRACGAYEAFLRTYRGPGDRARGGGVPAARPALPALGGLRAQPRRAVPGQPRGRRPAGRLPERGAAAARPDPRRAGVPLARDVVADLPGEMERLQRTCAPATEAVTRALLRAAPRRMSWQGGARDEHAAPDRAHHRLRVRRQGASRRTTRRG